MVSELFINSTGVTVGVVNGLTEMTGNLFSALLLIVILIVVLALALQIPLEITAIFILPFLLGIYAFEGTFTAVTGVVLIYVGLIVAKYFFIK